MKQKEYWNSVSSKKEFTTPFQAAEFSKYVKKDGHTSNGFYFIGELASP